MADIDKALKEAEALVDALKSYKTNTAKHLSLLKQTDRVRDALEEPYDVIMKQLEIIGVTSALYMLCRLEALEKIPVDGTITAKELAAAVNVDESAITRAMRMILASGFAKETAPDTYTHNAKSLTYLPQGLYPVFHVTMDFAKCWPMFPEYFKTHKPEDLYDPKKTPFAFSRGKEGMTYYDVINLDQETRLIWNTTLSQMDKNMPILGMFPFASMKEQVEADPSRPFIVDIGGGKGQALKAIQTECPNGFGAKMILQDLPIVINSLTAEDVPGIEKMSHDAFTPQPVRNAHIYFLRRLLHDFYAPDCITILRNTVSAMTADSRLIVCDMLVPALTDADGAAADLYWLDFSLLSIGGKEKTLKEFEDIFEAVGLKLDKVWESGVGQTVMLETRLK